MKPESTIGTRIGLIITLLGVSKKSFADSLGWSQPYLSRIITNAQGAGLSPVSQIIERYKDVDARWLITGEGLPFGDSDKTIIAKMRYLLELDSYLPYMKPEEKTLFVAALMRDNDLFPLSRMETWKEQRMKAEQAKIKEIQQQIIKNLHNYEDSLK